MPDLKDRYSDPELDRSNTAFDELVNRPDMKALDDQGDAVARDLAKSENNVNGPQGITPDNSGSNATREAEQEKRDIGFYKPDTQQKQPKVGWSRRRKIAAAGAGGGIATTLLVSLFALLPLKVPALMQQVLDQTGQRVEQITEKRAKLIIGRAILTKFGSHSGIVLTGDGAFSSLVASMRTSGFEKRLAEKGLVITQAPDGVKLTYKGKPLGNGTVFKNEAAIVDALDKDKLTNGVLKDIVREDIPAWRWVKRAKFAKWLRIKYNVPKYGLTNSDSKDPAEKKKTMDAERVKAATTRTSTNFKELVGCILSGSCDKVNGSGSSSKASASDNSAPNDLDQIGQEAVDDAVKNGIEETTKTATDLTVKKFGARAIPIIGWIDLIASLDHFVHEAGDNDYYGKVAAYYKGAAYAAVFAEWSGYGSQIQQGAMDPDYVGVLSDTLNGSEKAQVVQAMQGDPSKGVPVSLKVDSDKPSSVAELYNNILNSPLGFGNKYVGHPILNAYYESIGSGGLLGWIAGFIGDAISGIMGLLPINYAVGLIPDSVKGNAQQLGEWLLKETVSELGPAVLKSFGFTLDALDRGADLMNNIFGGGVVSTNDYCKEIGCRKLSTTQTLLQNTEIANEHAEYLKQKGLLYALFSPDEPTSVTTQLAVAMPTSPTSGLSSLGSAITAIPSRMASILMPKSAASGFIYEGMFGVAPYGATTSDLSRPLSQEFLNGGKCPGVPAGEYDACSVDNEVALAMVCEFTPEAQDCSDSESSDAPTSGGSQFRIATFNVLGESHTDTDYKDRMDRSIKILNDNDISIVGFQEFQSKQRTYFREQAGSKYELFDKNSGRERITGGEGVNAIGWDKTKFQLVSSGFMPNLIYFNGGNLDAPWVKLQDINTQQQFYILNTHDPAHPENTALRTQDAKQHVDFITTLKKEGVPIFFTGDFNSGYDLRDESAGNPTLNNDPQNLTYCILTKGSFMYDAYDLAEKRDVKCPNPGNNNSVDHIFLTDGPEVTRYWTSPGGKFKNGSDVHDTHMADITIPGKATTGEGGKFRIGSFNIYYNSNDSDPVYSKSQWQDRLKRSTDVIKNNNIQVVGLQEVRQDVWQRIQDTDRLGASYDIYPKNYGAGGYGSQNPIVWDTHIFDLVEGKPIPGYQVLGTHDSSANMQVKLRYKETGQEIYVINHHEPVGNDTIQARYDSANARATYVKELSKDGLPIFLTGDFNSGYDLRDAQKTVGNNRNNLAYCILTDNNLLWDSYDASNNKTGHCPTTNAPGVDHIFMSPTVKVTKYDYSISPRGNGSDVHNTLYADVELPGSDSSGGTVGGWSWPVNKSYWIHDRADFLSAHISTGTAWGADNMGTSDKGSGIAADIGDPPNGSPVYAMIGGVVTSTNLCGENDGIAIKSKIGDATVGIAYMHGTNKKFNVGDTVKSGQQIMSLGEVGCHVYGGHVHIGIAYNGKYICPQDVFLAMGAGKDPNLGSLTLKARAPCGR